MKSPARHRDWLRVFLWLTLGLILIPLYNVARELGHPLGGFINSRFIHDEVWRVDVATPPWWSGVAAANGVRPLDIIIAIADQPADYNQREMFAEVERQGHATVPVLVLDPRTGAAVERVVPVVPFTWAEFLDYRLPDLILFVSFWLLAFVLYQSQPHDPLSRAAVVMFCAWAV